MTPTKRRGTPFYLSGDRHPTLASLPSPEPMTGDEDSSEDEGCIIPSNPVDSPPCTTEAVEDDRQSATPELVTDMFSDVQPLPVQTINEVDNIQDHEQGSDSESDTDSSAPTAPRRSARSTKGIPPVHYGQVQIKSTIISELQKPTRYRQVLYVPCYP